MAVFVWSCGLVGLGYYSGLGAREVGIAPWDLLGIQMFGQDDVGQTLNLDQLQVSAMNHDVVLCAQGTAVL